MTPTEIASAIITCYKLSHGDSPWPHTICHSLDVTHDEYYAGLQLVLNNPSHSFHGCNISEFESVKVRKLEWRHCSDGDGV